MKIKTKETNFIIF